jgi:hypothetical protein
VKPRLFLLKLFRETAFKAARTATHSLAGFVLVQQLTCEIEGPNPAIAERLVA